MKIFVFGTLILIIAFILHIIIWRLYLPKRQVKAILYIFLLTMLVCLTILWLVPESFIIWGLSLPKSFAEIVHISLYVISFTFAYIITYSAIEADSPSLVMILAIAKEGNLGLKKDDFKRQMSDKLLIKPRIKDLLNDKMAVMDKDKYRLTNKGILMAKIFIIYRKLLKAPIGG